MKKESKFISLILIFLAVFLYSNLQAVAQEKSEENKDNKENEVKTQEEKIQDLKDRLATKVAEIRESQKGAVSGEINNLSDESFDLVTKKGEFLVTYSEDDTTVENLIGTKAESASVEDLEDDIHLVVFGLIDEEKNEIDAKRILIKPLIINLIGTIVEKDSKGFTFDVKTANGELFVVDYEKSTKTVAWNGEKIVKSGFSTVSIDDRVHVRAIPVKGDEKKVSARRILHLSTDLFEEMPQASEEPLLQESPEPEEE